MLEKSPDSSQGMEAEEESPGNMEVVSALAIDEVFILVGELRRVTFLWDELRLGTFIQYSSEVQRQIKRFQEEADRLAANKTISEQEKRDLHVDHALTSLYPAAGPSTVSTCAACCWIVRSSSAGGGGTRR